MDPNPLNSKNSSSMEALKKKLNRESAMPSPAGIKPVALSKLNTHTDQILQQDQTNSQQNADGVAFDGKEV